MLQTVFDRNVMTILLACFLLGGAAAPSASAQPAPETSAKAVNGGVPAHYRPNQPAKRAGEYFGLIWGVEGLNVKAVESGALIRFSYRVLDLSKAAIFNDKKVDAFLVAPALGIRLSVPSLEKWLLEKQTSQYGIESNSLPVALSLRSPDSSFFF